MQRFFGKPEEAGAGGAAAAPAASQNQSSRQRSSSVEEMGSDLFDKTVTKIPAKYKETADKVRPLVLAVLRVVDMIVPFLPQLWGLCKQAYAKLLPFWDEMSLVWGVILTFFGGSFMLTVTTVEAFRLVGKDKIIHAWKKIEDDILRLIQEYREQNHEAETPPEQWVQKNGLLVMRVVNPDDCRDALIGFYAGFSAVVACLRNQFAQVIALGVSCGETLETHFSQSHVIPFVKELVPEEHHKWVPFIAQAIFRVPTVVIVWFLQRIISAFHSAVRGADILANACLNFCHKRAIVKEAPSQELRAGVSFAFATVGLLFQLSSGFGLPWILAIPLLPFTVVEYLLGFLTLGL
eukprot:TRINITY_DN7957_c0_g2_i1.p2 TRINITY_DN7957_c0_g2~~TRINITY_DN7957_c0_g2_i1.p2  ORF type:complete len:368 (+),score=159.99 TRINITY_DN7957_c0_g2_i1:55-1104(+)